MIYTVTCNPAVDCMMTLDALCPGQLNRAADQHLHFGGKGINVSRVLQQLGLPSVALGFLAGPTGRMLEQALQADGLRTGFLYLESGMTRVNVKLRAGGETEVNGCGPAVSPAAIDRLAQQLTQAGQGDIVVLAGSTPPGAPETLYEDLARQVSAAGALAVVDAAGALLHHALAAQPFLVKPNLDELTQFWGRQPADDAELEQAARALQQKGAQNVLVSLGAAGALLVPASGAVLRAGAPGGRVLSTTGAGDSMVAGFLAGWLRTGRYDEALRWGIAAGSATAFSQDLARKDTIEALLQKEGQA